MMMMMMIVQCTYDRDVINFVRCQAFTLIYFLFSLQNKMLLQFSFSLASQFISSLPESIIAHYQIAVGKFGINCAQDTDVLARL